MRSGGWTVAVGAVVAIVGAGACNSVGKGSGAATAGRPAHLAYVQTQAGLAGVDALGGRVLFQTPGAVASPGWTTLVRSAPQLGGTRLYAIDTATGRTRWVGKVRAGLAVRVVATDGRRIALTEPAPARAASVAGYPSGRATTTLEVVGPAQPEPRRYMLAGNFEPEAFSLDGRALFVIEFSPPLAPDRYRVRSLDLGKGTVSDVASPDKDLQQDMRGSPTMQVPAPDGGRVYTLYSLRDTDGHMRSFVHVLSLGGRWAHCVDLPDEFSAPGSTMAVAPDGRHLVVVQGLSGDVAEIDTRALRVEGTGSLGSPVKGPVALTRDGRLFVVDDADKVLVVGRLGAMPRALDGVAPGALGLALTRDGASLLVAGAGRLTVVDTASGAVRHELPLVNVRSLGWPSPLLDSGAGHIECAC